MLALGRQLILDNSASHPFSLITIFSEWYQGVLSLISLNNAIKYISHIIDEETEVQGR